MFERLKKTAARLKVTVRSKTYIVIVAGLSALPITLVLYAWLYTWITGSRISRAAASHSSFDNNLDCFPFYRYDE